MLSAVLLLAVLVAATDVDLVDHQPRMPAIGNPVIPCGSWPLYKQCDARWANTPLGTSTTDTICTAGCAMSSVSMALAFKKITIGGQLSTPATLNAWLTAHGGYVEKDLIVWNSVAQLGAMRMLNYTDSLTPTELTGLIKSCEPVVVNVLDGAHWVLVTGYDSTNPAIFYVNDPGFNTLSYAFSGMLKFVVYSAA